MSPDEFSGLDAPSLIEGAHGLTLFATGQMLIREDWEYVGAVLSGKAPRTRRSDRLSLTINHECIHFIQCLTTSQLYKYSLSLVSLCGRITKESRSGRLTKRRLRSHKTYYNFLQMRLSASFRGLSAPDLMEGTAVVEGYFGTFRNATVTDFQTHLDEMYPGSDHPYRRVINIVCRRFGLELGLYLIGPLSFFALNTSQPVYNFFRFLDILHKVPESAPFGISANVLGRTVGINPDEWNIIPETIRQKGERHPIYFAYIERLANSYSDDPLLLFEMAARPSRLLSASSAIASQILPARIECNGGRGLWLGIAKGWSTDELLLYVGVATNVGVAERLIREERPYQSCPHSACPVHKTALCHAWYMAPKGPEWSACQFPRALENIFGATADDLMAIRAAALNRGRYFRLYKSLWMQLGKLTGLFRQ